MQCITSELMGTGAGGHYLAVSEPRLQPGSTRADGALGALLEPGVATARLLVSFEKELQAHHGLPLPSAPAVLSLAEGRRGGTV